MSFEINPVLAGKFDAPGYIPASTNIASSASSGANDTTAADNVTGPDSRRYTQFDRSATDAGTATMSFGDFLDMINPLEHIPVVSSVYRAMTDEQINPVSRVVGDVIYGGLIGGASAVLGGISAVADAGLESQTGKDSGGLAMAALFGPDGAKEPATQLASARTPTAPTDAGLPNIPTQADDAMLASATLPPQNNSAPVEQVSVSENLDPRPAQAPQVQPASSTEIASNDAPAAKAIPAAAAVAAKSYPINKQQFGGAVNAPDIQAQNMAIALAQSSPTMHMGHTIYTGKYANGPKPLPPMIAPTAVSANQASASPVIAPPPVLPVSDIPVSSNQGSTIPAASSNSLSTPMAGTFAAIAGTRAPATQLSPELMQDMMLKAISQYGHVASAPMTVPGSMFNLTN